MVYAMDALFGLPRKQSAGVSYREPLLGNLYFGNQSAVDEFVNESGKTKSRNDVSSLFPSFVIRFLMTYRHAMIS